MYSEVSKINYRIMYIKSAWSYVNKGLLAILGFLVISSLAALVYLAHTLNSLHTSTVQNSSSVGTVFVLQDLLINVQDLQRSVRGYVITGDENFLEPYQKNLQTIPSELHILRTNNNLVLTDQQVQRLVDLTNNILMTMEQTVQSRKEFGLEVAQMQVSGGDGEAVMRQLRQEITKLSSERLQNIGPTQRRSELNSERAIVVAIALAVLVLGTCIALSWYFKRSILQERALESTKNEFLSLASHQLRTPATNVKQYIGLLLDGYMGDLNEQQKHALQVAYKNNESEINIMNDLLNVAKLDLNRIQLHKKITNVMKVVRNVVRDYNHMAKDKQQTLRLEGPTQIMALIDEVYIKGVVENLIDNAIKYSKNGTRITVSVAREQDSIYISVKDHGLGIKKRDYGKLFNKFSRLDNEFSANSEGSGLGLYWVKQVVSLHRGSIEVTSREGKGSVFTVRLPVR